MGRVTITVTVSGGGGLMDEIDDSLDEEGFERYVIHGPRACGPCRANEEPDNVPCAECRGNLIDPDHDGDVDSRSGNMCQCRVGIRRKGERGAA